MVIDDAWRLDCAGVLSGWEVRVSKDTDLALQVWDVTDADSKEARLVSSSTFPGKILR